MYRVLSYPLSDSTPVWPGNPSLRTEPFESMAAGSMANTTMLYLHSHTGTHMDAPYHFNPAGPPAARLPIEAFIFTAPVVVETPLPQGGFITREMLEAHHNELVNADALFLRTGWSEVRESDPDVYVRSGPLLHPDGARYLLDNCPKLKAVGIDAISIGSPAHIPETIATHHLLTGVGRGDGRFVLIIEDMRIDPDLGNARAIYSWPLFIEGSDGSPCTIVADMIE